MIQPTKLFREVSPLSLKDCFIVIERHKSAFTFPIHVHQEFELNFVENAEGAQRIVGDSVEEIGYMDLVLIANPKLEHAWVDYHCTSKNIHEITIQFHGDLLSETILERNQLLSIHQLFSKATRGVSFSKEAIEKVRPLIKLLTCENDSFYSLIRFLIILHELSKDGQATVLSNYIAPDMDLDDNLKAVVSYLQKHYAEIIRLSDMAEIVHMSEISFSRFIKQHTSKSFVDFLNDIRLGEATRRLIDTTLSVAEIGYSCGFNNLSNFNRIFKKRKGQTPSEFRENYRRNRIIV